MKRPLLAVLALASLTAAGACASDDSSGPRRDRGPQRPAPNTFISPEGKPFHAAREAPYPVAVWFAEADADHDGKLTPLEFRQDAANFFRVLDTNHDGVLDGEEVAHYEETVAPEILPDLGPLRSGEGYDPNLTFGDRRNTGAGEPGQHRGYRQPRQPGPATSEALQGAGLFGLLNEPEPVAAADTQFNGRITLQQFEQAADRRFDLLDTKQRGYLALATLPKTPIQQEIERRAKEAAKHKKPPEQ